MSKKGELGDISDEEGVEVVSEGEVVGRAKGLPAELVKGDPADALKSNGDLELAALAGEKGPGAAPVSPGVGEEVLKQILVTVSPGPRVEHGALKEDATFPVVNAAIELVDNAGLLEEVDEGKEGRPVEPILVEVVRDAVGGGHKDHSLGKKLGEEPLQDHGVSDICDLELIKAEEVGLTGESSGHFCEGFGGVHPPEQVHSRVDVEHELVEMGPPFCDGWGL